jgi:hypothetical protein
MKQITRILLVLLIIFLNFRILCQNTQFLNENSEIHLERKENHYPQASITVADPKNDEVSPISGSLTKQFAMKLAKSTDVPPTSSLSTSDNLFITDNHSFSPGPGLIPHSTAGGSFLLMEVDGTVTLNWTAARDSLGHSFTYSIYYTSYHNNTHKPASEITDWILIDSDLVTSTCLWDTSKLSNGTIYIIKLCAACSEGLTAESYWYFILIKPVSSSSSVLSLAVVPLLLAILFLSKRRNRP